MLQGSFDIHQTERFFLMHKCVSQEPPAAAQQRCQLIRLTHNQSMSQVCQHPQRHPQRVSCRHWPQQMTRDLSIRWNQNPEQEQQKTRVQRMQSQRRRLREKISQSLPKRLRRLMMWRKKINLQKATKRLGWLKVWCTVCCSAIGLTYISYIYTHMIYKLLLHINCTFSPYLMLVDFFWLCTMTGRATSSKDHKTKPVGPKDTMWRERACQRQRAWQRAGEGKRSWEERWQWAAIG